MRTKIAFGDYKASHLSGRTACAKMRKMRIFDQIVIYAAKQS